MIPTGIEQSTAFTVAWWVIAFVVIVGALMVVLLPDLLKAALSLVLSFMGIAALFVMLGAEFLAVVQLLIYAGAIPILIIFAILVMQDVQRGNPSNRLRFPALMLASILMVIVIFVVVNTEWNLIHLANLPDTISSSQAQEIYSNSTPMIGKLLLSKYVLAVEVAALLLLASIIGAIALVRER